MEQWPNGYWILNAEVLESKALGDSKVYSAFQTSEVEQRSIRHS